MEDKRAAWDNLSYERQKKYLENHPGSKRKINKSPDEKQTEKVKDQESSQPAQVEPKNNQKLDWGNLERKVVDKMKNIKESPEAAHKFDLHEVGKGLDSFNPASGEAHNMHLSRDQHDIMNDQVTVAFRDLGRWETPSDVSPEDAEDYDWQEWAPGEGDKYMKKFTNWLSGQKWFNPDTMEPFLHQGEKNWAYFGIRPKPKG